ncbi:hypothetical protein, partial [Jatrophihabitans sp.]|uniref:hypothetical protein n=1 Tax=Jatrophihabitans sp. TaxID=1932789 RepID=UPI002C31739D|nr:hypothetical protein [Jatrophihabitans sp.]
LNSARKRDLSGIISAIATHKDFDEFKRFVTRGEVHEDQPTQTFLARLRTFMDPIEKVRNAVAHNRVVRAKALGDYETARDNLMVVLDETLAAYT